MARPSYTSSLPSSVLHSMGRLLLLMFSRSCSLLMAGSSVSCSKLEVVPRGSEACFLCFGFPTPRPWYGLPPRGLPGWSELLSGSYT